MSDQANNGGRRRRPRQHSYSEAAVGSLSNRAVIALWNQQHGDLAENERSILRDIVEVFETLAARIERPYSIGPERDFIDSIELATYLLDRQDVRGKTLSEFRQVAADKFRTIAAQAQAMLDGTATPEMIAELTESFDRLGEASLASPQFRGSETTR